MTIVDANCTFELLPRRAFSAGIKECSLLYGCLDYTCVCAHMHILVTVVCVFFLM